MNLLRTSIRVVKVGGSLLHWPEFPGALDNWLAEQPPAVHVLVCGGGPFADLIRQVDRHFELGEEKSHWLAIDTLGLTAGLLAALIPRAQRVASMAELQSIIDTSQLEIIVFDPRDFLRSQEAQLPGTSLPHTWHATSDSIAARLAEAVPADELILLKSSSPPAADHAALAAAGYVDAHFPTAANGLKCVRFVNLRGA